MSTSARRGRRPGSPDTRAAILSVARESFAAKGFAGTSVRGIAASAGVDAALVHHYFGSKDDLFVAALELTVDPREALRPVVEGGLDGAAERLLRVFFTVWDDEELAAADRWRMVRGVLEPGGQQLVRDGVPAGGPRPARRRAGPRRAERRMPLVASQLMGLVMLRYVLRAEPLASEPVESLVATYAPALQRYLSGPLA